MEQVVRMASSQSAQSGAWVSAGDLFSVTDKEHVRLDQTVLEAHRGFRLHSNLNHSYNPRVTFRKARG